MSLKHRGKLPARSPSPHLRVREEKPNDPSWWPLRIVKMTVIIAGQRRLGRLIAILAAITASINLLVALYGPIGFANSITYVGHSSQISKAPEFFMVTSDRLIDNPGRVLFAACGVFDKPPIVTSLSSNVYNVPDGGKCVDFTSATSLPPAIRLNAEGFHGLTLRSGSVKVIDATVFLEIFRVIGAMLALAVFCFLTITPFAGEPKNANEDEGEWVSMLLIPAGMLVGFWALGYWGILVGGLVGALLTSMTVGLVGGIADEIEKRSGGNLAIRILCYAALTPIVVPLYVALSCAFVVLLLFIIRGMVWIFAPHPLYRLFIEGGGALI